MSILKYTIKSIIDVLNLNLNLFGYEISLMSVILFVVLGGALLTFLIGIFDL